MNIKIEKVKCIQDENSVYHGATVTDSAFDVGRQANNYSMTYTQDILELSPDGIMFC